MAPVAQRLRLAPWIIVLGGVVVGTMGSATAWAQAAEVSAPQGVVGFRELLAEGKRLLKLRRPQEAVTQLEAAVGRARREGLPIDEQAVAYYMWGLALSAAERDVPAIAALRETLKLAPGDVECRLELAQTLLHNEEYRDAQHEAEAALRAGLGDAADQAEAKGIIEKARTEYVRERVSADLLLSFGYDSNVLESSLFTSVGGRCAGGCNQTQRQPGTGKFTGGGTRSQPRRESSLVSGLRPHHARAVVKLYNSPRSPQQEWDLPTSLQLELRGRLLGASRVELWSGYRFYQYLLTSAGYDHDAYNLEEHSLPLLLLFHPLRWLRLRSKLEGFINFSGLKQFAPYQGGLRASLDTTFIESPAWRTRLLYLHQYRRSLAQPQDGYLDGSRDDVKLVQELRVGPSAASSLLQLGYRFRSERTGIYLASRDFQPRPQFKRPPPGAESTEGQVPPGTFDYAAPLGYLGHELSLHGRLSLPPRVELGLGAAYENRRYDGLYGATYTPSFAQAATIFIPAKQRVDSLVTVDTDLLVHVGRGFSLGLSYMYQRNFSSIANLIDNRNFDKHSVAVSLLYSF